MSDYRRANEALAKLKETKVSGYIQEQLKKFGNTAGTAKRAELETYLCSQDFITTCSDVFQRVDVDRSNSIDPNELAQAFQLVIENLPGASDAVHRAMKSHSSSNLEVAAKELANEAFAVFDLDKSGSLDTHEFVYACRLMWCTALTWIADASPAEAQVTTALDQYAELAGIPARDELTQLFQTFEFTNLCKTVFNQVDTDGNKTLDASEVLQACRVVANELASTVGDATQRNEILQSFSDDLNEDTVTSFVNLVDVDNNGTLDEVEFITAVKLLLIDLHTRSHRAALGKTDDYVAETLNRYAGDLGEARVAFLNQLFRREEFPTECTMAFHRVDEDDSHALDKDELAHALRYILRTSGQIEKLSDAGVDVASLQRALGNYLIDKIFNVVDTDGSGMIEANEFPAVVKLFWIHVLRVDALGGIEAVESLEREASSPSSECKTETDSGVDLGAKRGTSSPTNSDNAKRVELSEESADTPAARAVRLTDHIVLKTAIQARLTECEETKDGVETGAQAFLEPKIQEMLALFRGEEFQQACDAAFTSVDSDGSGTIERNELGEAFSILVNEVPNAAEKLKSLGVDTEEDFELARSQLVEGVYQMLAEDESGSLNREQFSLGMRLMWMQLAL